MRDLNSDLKAYISVLILFDYKLMIGNSKNLTEKMIRENAFEHKKKKPGLNLTPD